VVDDLAEDLHLVEDSLAEVEVDEVVEEVGKIFHCNFC
jgi:hypothetical protein